MSVSDELKVKRDELAGRVRDLTAEMAELQAQISAVDKVIAIYEPEWRPQQPQKRRGRPPKADSVKDLNAIIGGTNKRQMTLDILRTARRPLSTAECAKEFAARHGLAEDVDFHREVTRAGARFPLRIDPCETLPLAGIVGGYRSDRHGVFDYYPALGTA